jgi:hypothetical protein
MNRGDSVVAIGLELGNVTDVDAVGLHNVDVDDVAILWVLSGTRLLNWQVVTHVMRIVAGDRGRHDGRHEGDSGVCIGESVRSGGMVMR